MAGEQHPPKYVANRPPVLNGAAVVTYPYGTDHRRIERFFSVYDGTPPTAWKAIEEEFASAILVERNRQCGDAQMNWIFEAYEDLPGPDLITSRTDPDDGSVITEIRQTVLTSPSNVGSSIGGTTIKYEPRGDSALVSIKITSTVSLDGVVTSSPVRVHLDLPATLAGIAVTYGQHGGDGKDDSDGSSVALPGGGAAYSVTAHSSARASGSLSITPEIYAPLRLPKGDPPGSNAPGTVKQIYLEGAITEAAILARMTAVYEVVITATMGGITPNLLGTYLGNDSDSAHGGVIWFSVNTGNDYLLKYDATEGKWKLGQDDAHITAGNYWSLTAAATSWLGNYTAHGANTGTAIVSAGRTVALMPVWATEEVVLLSAGSQVSVSCNADASNSVSRSAAGDFTKSLTLGTGFSIQSGGSQQRVTIHPTLHGEIIIANPEKSGTVNAPVTATLPTGSPWTGGGGTSSGVSPTHAQTALSYVRSGIIPATEPPDIPRSGLLMLDDYRVSPGGSTSGTKRITGTIVDMTYLAQKPASIEYSDPVPAYAVGVPIIANQPIVKGGPPTSYSISSLTGLTGLTFDTTTGIFTGTPSAGGLSATAFTITGTNAQGSATCTVTITINV